MRLSDMLRGYCVTEKQLQGAVSWAWANHYPDNVPESEHRFEYVIIGGILQKRNIVLTGILKVKGAAA